jgi:hypothetical protein
MKNIYLIKDAKPFWADIERALSGVNAKVSTFDGQTAQEAISRQAPDLIIIAESIHHDISAMVQKLPKLILKKNMLPGTIIQGSTNGDCITAGWPLEEKSFLEITSRLLFVSERRKFRAMIRIFTKGVKTGFAGQSEDFSLTGIAFKTDQQFPLGEEVAISFYVTEVKKSIKLDAEITRQGIDPADGSSYYGARFINLSSEDKEVLKKFIWRKS